MGELFKGHQERLENNVQKLHEIIENDNIMDRMADKGERTKMKHLTRNIKQFRDNVITGVEELLQKSAEHAEQKRMAAEAEQERLAAKKREREQMLAENPQLAAEHAERERRQQAAEQAEFAQLLQQYPPEEQAAGFASMS